MATHPKNTYKQNVGKKYNNSNNAISSINTPSKLNKQFLTQINNT